MIGTNFGIYRPITNTNIPNSATANSNNNTNNNNTNSNNNNANSNNNNTNTNNNNNNATPNITAAAAAVATTQECTQLSDFMQQLEDYIPTVPDAVIAFYLNSAGFDTSDPRIIRLISVATQKFISDVANDALQHCKTRTNNQNGLKGFKVNKERKYTMTTEDLASALADFGITVRKAQYFP